ETLDWEKSNWYTTPTESYADYTALSQLPKVKLKVTSHTEFHGRDATVHVTVENPSKSLAFFVRLKVNRPKPVGPRMSVSSPQNPNMAADTMRMEREEILPVLWDDNYISLLPGEKRELTARYRVSVVGASNPSVAVSGWNVQ